VVENIEVWLKKAAVKKGISPISMVSTQLVWFRRLEALDEEPPSGIKDEHKLRGLALPLDVLAMRIYPHLADALARLG